MVFDLPMHERSECPPKAGGRTPRIRFFLSFVGWGALVSDITSTNPLDWRFWALVLGGAYLYLLGRLWT